MLRTAALLAALVAAAPASAAVSGTVTLGMVNSQTGAAATLGVTQLRGAQMAVDELNAASELGFTLALEVRDDGSTGEGAKAAFTELIDAGVTALIGPTLSGSAFVSDPVAQAAGVPVVAVSNTADGITEMGDYIFRASLAERRQIPRAVTVAHRRLKFKRPVMIVRTDQPFAVSGAKAFRKAMKAAGAPIVKEVSYTGAPASFDALLRKLAKAKPDVLVIESLTEGPQLMQEARQIAGLKKVSLMGGNAFNSLSVIEAAGSAAEGLIVGAAWHPAVPDTTSRAFVKRYRARYTSTPDQFAATAYSAVEAIAQAVKAAGTTDRTAVRDALAATRGLPTPLGPFGFGASRNVIAKGVVQIVRDGRFRLLT
jgi:branched-chain amino acid transport system substrate-binding protein